MNRVNLLCDILIEKLDSKATTVELLKARERIHTLEINFPLLSTKVTNLTTDLAAAKSNITTLQSKVSALETELSSIKTNYTNLETRIKTLEDFHKSTT